MKEGGYLVYKCRRCGGLDKSCHAHDALTVLIEIVNNGIFNPHERGFDRSADNRQNLAPLRRWEYRGCGYNRD